MMNEMYPQQTLHTETNHSYSQGLASTERQPQPAFVPYHDAQPDPLAPQVGAPAYQQSYQPVFEQRISLSFNPESSQYSIRPALNDAPVFAALSYLFGWVSGLLILIFGSQSRLARFHALQSILFFGALTAFDIVVFSAFRWDLPFVGRVLGLGLFLTFMSVHLVAFVGWLLGMIQAARGLYFKLPLVGDVAQRLAGPELVLK